MERRTPMKKCLLPLVLALVMAFSMMPMAGADFYLEYPHLEIGTEGVFDFTPETNPPLNKNASGQGWSWNAATYTLTLNGVNQPKMDLYITDADKPVTIVVNGTNTLRTFGEISVTSVVDVTSTMIGSGTLNLKGYSGGVDVANGPTVNADKSFHVGTLNAGTISTKVPLEMPLTVNGGCFIIDAKEHLAQDTHTNKSLLSAICPYETHISSDFLQGCSIKDETGQTVTLEKRPIIFSDGSVYGYKLVAVKSNGDCADYVKITPANYNPFADVKTSDYFAKPVLWAVDRGITNGTSATKFSPNQTCTQGQILTFLYRAVGQPAVSGANQYTNPAVNSDWFYYDAMIWAQQKGIVTDKNLDPNADCKRSDVVLYQWRLAGSPKVGSADFSDVSASAPYAQAVAWAVKEAITTGTSTTTFSPNDTCTRGQIVTFLYRDLA